MAKAQYDNTVHNDEHHYNVSIAAAFADREANEATEKRLRAEHRRLVERLDTGDLRDFSDRNAANNRLAAIDREIRETVERRKTIEEQIKEATA